MSLIAWWPLNGNTNNYGTLGAELQATASSTTFVDGKIGKALYKGSLTITGEQWKKIIGNTISIAMWIYTRDDGSYSAGVPFFGMDSMTAPNNRKFSMFHYNTKTNLHCSWQHDNNNNNNNYWGCHYSNFFELNKWVHLCIVQDAATNTVTVYRNGEQYSKSTVNGLSSMNFKEAGTAPVRANIDYQYMSDLRIYNHALSIKEVRELSKGLMLHYTFNDIGSESTTNLITGIKSAHGKSSLYGNGVKINWSPSGGDSYFMFNYSQTIKANSVYTLSFDCEGLKSDEVATFAVSNLSAASYNIALKNGRNKLTFTAGSDLINDINTHNRLFFDDKTRTDGAVFYLSNFQLEEKDHATAYVNGSRNNPYYDESGYNNDGIQNQIDYTSNSNNGSCCASFNGTHSYIELPNWKPSLPNEPYTIAFWINPTENGVRDVIFGNHNNSSQTFNIERHTENQLRIYYHGDGAIGYVAAATMPANTWTHIAITFNGSICRVYKNGEEVYSKALSTTLNCTNANWKIGSDYRATTTTSESTRFKGKISDFRIYASALTSAQILELYESKAEIDKNNNIYTNEIIEQQNTGNMVNAASWEQNGIGDASGNDVDDMMTRIRSKYIPVLPSATYYYGVQNSSMTVRGVHYYNASNIWISYDSGGGNKTTPSNCAYVRWVIQNTNTSTEVPVANITTYGPYMVYQGQPTPQGLDEGTEVQVNKDYTITTKDICEGHDSGFFIDGTATGNQFYEI